MIRSTLSFFLLLVILTAFFPDLATTLVTLITRVLELLLRTVDSLGTQALI